MILSLRQAIYKKLEGKTKEDLVETIENSVEGDERALPGLGVLFEVLWQNIDQEMRDQLVQTIGQHMPKLTTESN